MDGVRPGPPDERVRVHAVGLLRRAGVRHRGALGGALAEDVVRRVGDVVPGGAAAALERVEEAEEVPDLVDGDFRPDVVGLADALGRQSGSKDVDEHECSPVGRNSPAQRALEGTPA